MQKPKLGALKEDDQLVLVNILLFLGDALTVEEEAVLSPYKTPIPRFFMVTGEMGMGEETLPPGELKDYLDVRVPSSSSKPYLCKLVTINKTETGYYLLLTEFVENENIIFLMYNDPVKKTEYFFLIRKQKGSSEPENLNTLISNVRQFTEDGISFVGQLSEDMSIHQAVNFFRDETIGKVNNDRKVLLDSAESVIKAAGGKVFLA